MIDIIPQICMGACLIYLMYTHAVDDDLADLSKSCVSLASRIVTIGAAHPSS